ncbi:MAG TPA: hypothetical protein VKB58_14615 [Terriglobales bacterium]|nr:hypothetical protein [Terriglobales bacterium]
MNESPQRAEALRSKDRELELQERQRARDQRKVIGLLIIALLILALAFFRFGSHIPWGAR